MNSLPPDFIDPPGPHERPYPPVAAIVEWLRSVFGAEMAVGPSMLRWWVDGDKKEMGVSIMIDPTPPTDGPSVIWVARPGEAKPERCPIVSMPHLEAFLALVSIARHSRVPVHGHVCPGED